MLATRMGDFVVETCGKGDSGPFIQGSLNTFTNNRPQVRMGDKSIPGISLKGSTKKFTNNRPTTRIIDPVVCGQTVQSSLNTFIF
jgi:uncharacterized Zn-binding protein involved in type VI secretion